MTLAAGDPVTRGASAQAALCPYCKARTDVAREAPARIRCAGCHRVILRPSTTTPEVTAEVPRPHIVLGLEAPDSRLRQEAAWVRILANMEAGLSRHAVEQAWEAYHALRKPRVIYVTGEVLHPLDGPEPGSCLMCSGERTCPRCRPEEGADARRAGLYVSAEADARRELAAHAVACGEFHEALFHASRAPEGALWAAAVHLAAGQPARALKLCPDTPAAAWLKARGLIALSRPAEALPLLEAMTQPAARYLAACALAVTGQATEAATRLKELARGEGELPWCARVSFYALARKDPQPLVAHAPRNPMAYVLIARAMLRAGQLDPAVTLLTRLEALPEALLWRGHALASARRTDEAMTFYENVLKIIPEHEEALVCLAQIALRTGQFGRVIKLEESPTRKRVDPRFPYLQALCRLRGGQAPQGMAQLVELARHSDDPAVHEVVRSLHLQRGDSQFAAARFPDAAGAWKAAGADRPEIRARIGEAYLRQTLLSLRKKDVEGAASAITQAREFRGSPVDLYYSGVVALARGDHAGAMKHLAPLEGDAKVGIRAAAHHRLAAMLSGEKVESLPPPGEEPVGAALARWVTVVTYVHQLKTLHAYEAVHSLLKEPALRKAFPHALKDVEKIARRLGRRLGEEGVGESTGTGTLNIHSMNLMRAVQAYEAGQLDRSRELIREVVKAEPDGDAPHLLQALYGRSILERLDRGKRDEALELCAQAAEEPGLEGDWEGWQWGIRLQYPPTGCPLDPRTAKAGLQLLEKEMAAAASSSRAPQLMPWIRRHAANLSYMLAIQHEEDSSREAEGYWVRALNYWMHMLRSGELEAHLRALAERQFGEVDPAALAETLDELLRVDLLGVIREYESQLIRTGNEAQARVLGALTEPLFMHVLEQKPDDPWARNQLSILYYNLAFPDLEAQRWERCTGMLKQAVELAPEMEVVYLAASLAHFKWAVTQMNRQDIEGAHENVLVALAANPFNGPAQQLKSRLATLSPVPPRDKGLRSFYERCRMRIEWYSFASDSVGEDLVRAIQDMVLRGMGPQEVLERLMSHQALSHVDPATLMGIIGETASNMSPRRPGR